MDLPEMRLVGTMDLANRGTAASQSHSEKQKTISLQIKKLYTYIQQSESSRVQNQRNHRSIMHQQSQVNNPTAICCGR